MDYKIHPPIITRIQSRNCLRVEFVGVAIRCKLRPKGATARYILEKRPLHINDFWYDFGNCIGSDCNNCKINKKGNQMNLTTTQAAHLRKVDTSTIRRWCESGKLKAVKWGRDWQIDADDLAQFQPKPVGRPKETMK